MAHSIKHLIVGSYSLELVVFKYVGVNINHKNHLFNEVKHRINSVHCDNLILLIKLSSSRMLSWATKENNVLNYVKK